LGTDYRPFTALQQGKLCDARTIINTLIGAFRHPAEPHVNV
jgi:hypothetical protein